MSGHLPHSACAFQRATKLAADERKVFILHDEAENATAARLRTVNLARSLDNNRIVAYYRNAMHKAGLGTPNSSGAFRASWNGATHNDRTQSVSFIRATCHRKGPYYALVGLGQSGDVLRLVAKEHRLEESKDVFPDTGSYPITLLTSNLFTVFKIPAPRPFSSDSTAELPELSLPNEDIVARILQAIETKEKLFNMTLPSLEEKRAEKKAKKKAMLDAEKEYHEQVNQWKELVARKEAGEDVEVPPKPVSGRHKRRDKRIERRAAALEKEHNNNNSNEAVNDKDETQERSASPSPSASSSDNDGLKTPLGAEQVPIVPASQYMLYDGYSALTDDDVQATTDLVSNYVSHPSAEPVTPCDPALLGEMITWLEKDVDIVADQEPRIDFVRGSILGKTTMGGGTSVDLCKQVVGPKGIKPILDAVGKNSHIDRFLLGNNIVGDEGGQVIADFIASDKSKRIYNFYIAGNSIGPQGIRAISRALSDNDTVTALWLKRNPLFPQGARHLSSMLSINTTLQTLDVVNTGIGDDGAAAIVQGLKQNSYNALKHLYLGCNAEGIKTARALGAYLKSGTSNLTSLFVSSSRLGDEGIMVLSEGLKHDKKIERLGLESVRMGDEGCKALTDALVDHPSIVFIDLGFRKGTFEMGERSNNITEEGLFYLADKLIGKKGERKNNTIRLLDFSGNKISKEAQQRFMNEYMVDNQQLLRVRLAQKGEFRNIKVENAIKKISRENSNRYFSNSTLDEKESKERERVKEALNPLHVAEIYSVYRGNM